MRISASKKPNVYALQAYIFHLSLW